MEVITFDDDQAIVEQPVPDEVSIPLLPGISHTDFESHSVISFLRRPQLLSSFRWRTSATRSQNLYQLPNGTPGGMLIPTHMIGRGMAKNKLDGFTSLKATAVIKLLVNAQPFQCGRLLMAAAPMPSLLGNRKEFLFSNVSQTQNIQHVQMDIAKDTKVILRVPFISPYSCFDLIDGKFDWAELRILVYSPLNSINGDCVECNVYAHFEDIQLGAPTSGEVLVQQSAPASAVDAVRKKEAKGTLTGALAKLGNTLVSKSLSAVSPILSAGDAVLAAAGWAKPVLAKPTQVILNRPQEGFAYMDGVDQSLVLGMTASNAVEAMPHLVGTGIDETDFHRLKRIPQFIAVFKYSNNIQSVPSCSMGSNLGDQVPKLLWSCAVAPTCNVPACYNITVPTSTATGIKNPYVLNWKQPTTLNYITSPFLYWTGSLVYTFKFVKTDYHSGRVEISYHPFVNTLAPNSDANWLANRMDYVYRAVVDLRKNSEVSVTIPYIAAQPWKRVSTYLDPVNPNPPAPGRAKDIITGILAVRALTPLFASQTVSPTIEVLVEMRAGDDYEVQGPVTSKFLPFSFGNVDFPVQQSGGDIYANIVQQSSDFRVPASIGRIYVRGWSVVDAKTSPPSGGVARMVGLKGYPLVHVDIWGSVNKREPGNSGTDWRWFLTLRWDSVWPTPANVVNEKYAMFFTAWPDNGYDFHQSIVIPNPDDQDELYCSITGVIPTTRIAPEVLFSVDIMAYGRQLEQTIKIDSGQLPLPVSGGGGGGDVVTINPASLPLPVKIDDVQPIHVAVDQPLEVKIDSNQLPLPTANQGGGGEQIVKISNEQLPLNVVTQNPVQVELLAEQFPLDVKVKEPIEVIQTYNPLPVEISRPTTLNVKLDESQLPLPTTGGGGGGGGTVSINPDQLPLWVSDYNIAPEDPRNPGVRSKLVKDDAVESTSIFQQSGGNLNKVATSGITETRTNAMEGWMPPSISGNDLDAHRPSTAQFCAGERFFSFRQYSRRFAFCLVSGLDSGKMMKIQPVELIRPGILSMRITPGTAAGNDRTQYALYAPNSSAEVSGSPLNFVAGMYAFYRGSVRFKVWMDPRENPPNLVSGHLEYSRQTNDTNVIDDNIENFMTPVMYETPLSKQIAEYQVPYYSPTVVSSTWSHGLDSQFDIPLCNLIVSIPDVRDDKTKFPIKVAVAGGDDMDFHQFIGPPPVINVGDLLTTGRQLHYPPSGFTPTQKIVKDTARTDEAATSFVRVPYSALTVSGNPTGGSCGGSTPPPVTTAPPTTAPPTSFTPTYTLARTRRSTDSGGGEGVDTVDVLRPLPCPTPGPGLDYDAYIDYYNNCQNSHHIL